MPLRNLGQVVLLFGLSLLATSPFALAAEPAPKKAAKAPRYADTLIPALKPARLVTYREVGGRALRLHVFLPPGWKASDRRPAFVAIHGGGWTGGDATRMYPFADYFARQGMVAFSVEYRLLKPGTDVTVFDCVQDGRAAVRYVRAHAAEFGIDPARIVTSGASAGGHVAVGTVQFGQFDPPGGNRQVPAEPNALVLFYPVIDTSPEGYGNAKIGARWRELSPAHNVRAGLPPTLTFHGTGDTTTPFKGAQAFHDAMLRAGNRSELEVQPGGVHGYLLVDKKTFEATLERTERFLRSLGLWPSG